MEEAPVISPSGTTGARELGRSRRAALVDAIRAARRDGLAGRARRVALMITLIWILSIFDLALTISAQAIGGFKELNPIANCLVDDSGALTTFKLTTLALGSTVLLAFRRHLLTELGCWLVSAVYTVVAFMWMEYVSYLG